MDPLALTLANRLVGNGVEAAGLEITAQGPELVFDVDAAFALAGADLSATLEGVRLTPGQAQQARAGQTLQFGARAFGARAYLAVAGGLGRSARLFLGSTATDIGAGLGGLQGRALRAGDVLALEPQPPFQARAVRGEWARWYQPPDVVRFIPEPGAQLPAEAREHFQASAFRISSRSNRVGYRLEGPVLPSEASGGLQLSEPVAPGTIQLPPDGQPIVLMADRQTTGGYPRLGHVIRADVPKLAQRWLGDTLTFRAVTLDEARQALHELHAWLEEAVE
jgi:biotin-dependent carboxylase-like uncharacterized protein